MRNHVFGDTETTGLLLPQAAPLESQPHIVEICFIYLGGEFHSFVKPPVSIPSEVSRIHGITNETVMNSPSFSEIASEVCGIMQGNLVHFYNASFDSNVIRYELMRLGKILPPCSFVDPMHDAQMDTGKRWKQADLYAALTGSKLVNAHSALADTRALKIICETLAQRRQK